MQPKYKQTLASARSNSKESISKGGVSPFHKPIETETSIENAAGQDLSRVLNNSNFARRA
jgi:hypothetical protein